MGATEHSTRPLRLMNESTMVVYLWATEPDLVVSVDAAEAQVGAKLRSPLGKEMALAASNSNGRPPGVWLLSLRNAGDSPVDLTVRAANAPSHFTIPGPAMRQLGAGKREAVWLDVPEGLDELTLQTWLPAAARLTATAPDGGPVDLEWLPNKTAYHTAVVPVQGRAGWWRLESDAAPGEYRLTTWEGLPMFFDCPPERFPYARIQADVTDDATMPIDARITVLQEGALLTLRDTLEGEEAAFVVPPGSIELRTSCGVEYVPAVTFVRAHANEDTRVAAVLKPYVSREFGWACGDHHVHSWREDGAQGAERIARAARAAGLDYVFVTDAPEEVLADGLDRYDEPSRFLAMPGQELCNPDCHMNALNTRRRIACPGYGEEPEAYPGPGEWWAEVQAQAGTGRPAALMLNHPSHIPQSMERYAYFRSWWLFDKHDELVLVENADFESWFARLNAGRRVTMLWTTDSHDAVFLPPGSRRTYVHVGDELTEATVIEGLLAGRCFNTRVPGALLFVTVNGAMPGETAAPESGEFRVEVRCQATRLIDRVELIADGQVLYAFHSAGSMTLDATAVLQAGDARWLLARAYLIEEPVPKDGHTGTPFDLSGCVAFTNPVFCGR